MGKLLDKFDDGMLYVAGKALKGYNWATGKRKASLANNLLKVSTVFKGTGFLTVTPCLFPLVLVDLFESHLFQESNKYFENLEDNNSETIPQELSNKKSNSKIIGKFNILTGSVFTMAGYSINDNKISLGTYLISFGKGVESLSHYVMALDQNPPKRDNVLKRAKDGLVEKLEGFKVPELATQRSTLYEWSQRIGEASYAFA